MRILLLDDGVDGTEKLLEWFSECGDIEMASVIKTKELFLEKAVSERPDAVFIHAGRSRFPGFKTGEALRAADGRVLIVFLSDEKKSALDAFETGADGFLLCPVEKEKVKKCVENLKKRAALRTQADKVQKARQIKYMVITEREKMK
ncbi:MAG: hypothetical protein VB112_00230 [Oscillospiraceae bacterium]|nr:hypothetical protein [Oscillospiraceae bacterium]